jgi:alkylhydroperoxidase family enzyme
MDRPGGQLLPTAGLSDDFVEALQQRGSRPNDLFRSIANHPKLLETWSDYIFSVRFDCELPRSLRELAIVRCAETIGADFVRFHHLRQARDAGVSEAQLNALPSWSTADCFNAQERACLDFTDAFLGRKWTDATLHAVSEHFTPAERVELLLTVSQYEMIGNVVTFLGVSVPSEVPG